MSVLGPTAEILFFASPKKSIQKKGDPGCRLILRSVVFAGGRQKGLPAPLPTCAIHGAPLTGCSRRKQRCSARQNGRNPGLRPFSATRNDLIPCYEKNIYIYPSKIFNIKRFFMVCIHMSLIVEFQFWRFVFNMKFDSNKTKQLTILALILLIVLVSPIIISEITGIEWTD